jgi:hypothetical protein
MDNNTELKKEAPPVSDGAHIHEQQNILGKLNSALSKSISSVETRLHFIKHLLEKIK